MTTEASRAETDVLKLEARANLLLALLSHARQELQQQKDLFQDHLEHRDSRISELDNEVRRRDGRISELHDEVRRRGGQIDELKNELARLRATERNLKMTVAALMQSTSWRITAPLRAMGRAVKKAN